jgi:hypothetical protein
MQPLDVESKNRRWDASLVPQPLEVSVADKLRVRREMD